MQGDNRRAMRLEVVVEFLGSLDTLTIKGRNPLNK